MSALVEVRDICKVYHPGENEVRALDHVSVSIEKNEFVAIIGHSGSGKSTLMNLHFEEEVFRFVLTPSISLLFFPYTQK